MNLRGSRWSSSLFKPIFFSFLLLTIFSTGCSTLVGTELFANVFDTAQVKQTFPAHQGKFTLFLITEKTDILFARDQSGSMKAEMELAQQAFVDFANTSLGEGVNSNLQINVITADHYFNATEFGSLSFTTFPTIATQNSSGGQVPSKYQSSSRDPPKTSFEHAFVLRGSTFRSSTYCF